MKVEKLSDLLIILIKINSLKYKHQTFRLQNFNCRFSSWYFLFPAKYAQIILDCYSCQDLHGQFHYNGSKSKVIGLYLRMDPISCLNIVTEIPRCFASYSFKSINPLERRVFTVSIAIQYLNHDQDLNIDICFYKVDTALFVRILKKCHKRGVIFDCDQPCHSREKKERKKERKRK